MAHARFSPSAAERWLACPGSIQLEATYPYEPPSEYAREGTIAHSLNEIGLNNGIGAMMSTKQIDNYPIDSEMLNHSLSFVKEVLQIMEELKSSSLQTEQRVELKANLWGTADVVLVAPRRLAIIDYKYGQGIEVDAVDNPQLAIYAMAALKKVQNKKIKEVDCYIYQPRKSEHIKKWTVSVTDLKDHWWPSIKRAMELAESDSPPIQAGEHCRWCKARFDCSARLALVETELTTSFDDTPVLPAVSKLTIEQRARIIAHSEIITNWLGDLKEFAQREMEAGIEYPGLKLVRGRSHRRWTNETLVEQVLTEHLDDIYKKSLKSVAEVEKELDRKTFEASLGTYVEKPPGKLTLALVSDKRSSARLGFTDDLPNADVMEKKENGKKASNKK